MTLDGEIVWTWTMGHADVNAQDVQVAITALLNRQKHHPDSGQIRIVLCAVKVDPPPAISG
jgi:hypothetical protein